MTNTETAVLLVLVDGLRHDYLNPADAPFLHELSSNNWSCRLHETYAFELRPAFLAGLQPEECGIANMFLHDPKGSPFAGLDLEKMDRAAIDLAVKEVELSRGHSASAHYAFSAAIPRDLLPCFAFSETHLTWEEGALGGHPTLFDHLRKAGKKWLWLAYPDGDLRAGPLVQAFEEQLQSDHSLIFLHFGELDWVGHEAGPGSAPTREKLREIDQALAKVFARLNRTRSEVRSLIFGDHGMVAVERTMDMAGILAQTGLRLGEDYLYFLDSTQARFWFRQEGARERVLAALQGHPEGSFLTPSDLERLRYRFPDHRYGQEIFAVREGTVLFPNFFQDSAPPKGMHGYLPEVEANWSAAILTGATGGPSPSEPRDLTALYPTVLEFLDLPLPPSPAPLPVDLYTPPERTLTALIPTRNRAEILGLCLEALGREARGLEQEVEIIVVDDGSSDATEATVSESRKTFPDLRISYLRQDPAGPAAARNRGLREARGKLILFMNDDTIAETGFLRDHMAWHDQHPALGAALLGELSWDGAITPTPFRGWLLRDGPLCALDGLPEDASLDYRYFVTANLSIKYAFLKRHGFFDENFRKPMLEDTELGYRLQLQGLDLHLRRSARGRHRHEIRLTDFCRRQELVGRGNIPVSPKTPRAGPPAAAPSGPSTPALHQPAGPGDPGTPRGSGGTGRDRLRSRGFRPRPAAPDPPLSRATGDTPPGRIPGGPGRGAR